MSTSTEAPVKSNLALEMTWHRLVPQLLREHGSRVVAEVGVWRGTLSQVICRECPSVQRLILVDPWTVVYAKDEQGKWMVFGPGVTEHEMRHAYSQVARWALQQGERVTILKMPSREGAERVPDGSLDAVMIDALHTYQACKEDILLWRPKVRPGGLIIGDDLSEWFPGVQQAVEEVFGDTYRALGQTWWRIV